MDGYVKEVGGLGEKCGYEIIEELGSLDGEYGVPLMCWPGFERSWFEEAVFKSLLKAMTAWFVQISQTNS